MKKRFSTLPLAALAVLAVAGCDSQTAPSTDTATAEPTTATVDATATTAPTTAATKPAAKPAAKPTAKKAAALPKLKAIPKDATELIIEDTKVGTGAVAESGKRCIMHYTGTLSDGTKFDSSLDRGEPFPFTLGAGEVIKGWDEGVAGMKVGGKRRLIIPPALGYGERGAGGVIGPNATLVFTIELMGVE